MSNQQYKTSDNLNTRGNLHSMYSTNPEKWMVWLFRQYAIRDNAAILEIGCGNGMLWKCNANSIKASWNITLSDKSKGMIEESKRNLEEIKGEFRYTEFDIENEKAPGNYQYVIANHMLYHLNDIEKALSNIDYALDDIGVMYASTTGKKI